MNKFKNIIKSGAREINIITPHRSCYQSLNLSELKAFSFNESPHALERGVNLVVFSNLNEELVTAYAIYYGVIPPITSEAAKVDDLYLYLKQSAGNYLSYREAMRRCGLKTYNAAKQYIDRFISSGLFFPIDEIRYPEMKSTGKRYLVPYYYSGRSYRILIARHLLSLGFDISTLQLSDERYCDIYGKLHGRTIAVCFGGEECIDTFLSLDDPDVKIIINEEGRIPNFSGIRSMSTEEFLSQVEFL